MGVVLKLPEWLHDPVVQKRWARFRRRRRAWWSLWILLGLYAISLLAELLCNDRPLYVHYLGRSYFPVVFFHPEDTFTRNGRLTRPDYKRLSMTDAFRPGSGNFMVFPPVPFGPSEILDAGEFASLERVVIVVSSVPRAANINVGADGAIVRATSAGWFFGMADDSVSGTVLTNHWELTPGLHAGIESRLANRESPEVQAQLRHRHQSDVYAVLVLPAYQPRASAPTSVRLALREALVEENALRVYVTRDGRIAGRTPPLWMRLDTSTREGLIRAAVRRFDTALPEESLLIDGRIHRLAYEKQDITWPFEPVRGHWLGVDSAGRDVLVILVYGFRVSLTFGLLLVVMSAFLGIVLGAAQGFYGGRVDMVGQRLTEIWHAIPFLYVMMLLASVYGRSFGLLLVCYLVFNWIGISYYIRGECLRLRRQPFIDAARALGIPRWKIILRHVLPNAMTPVVTFFPFMLVGAIGSLAALDYLGFGVPPPTASWGELLHQAQQFRWAWWLILYPSLALFIVMMLGVFVGEGVRDAYDPKPFSRME